jgi:hypothetical protein
MHLNNLNNVCFFTYTHSNCSDVWKSYVTRLEKHSQNKIASYILSNVFSQEFPEHKFLTYDDNASYSREFIKALEAVPHEYFIYMQEDFILYDNIDLEKINSYIDILKNDKSISYVRMIKCGDVTEIPYASNLYYVSPNGIKNSSINSFSMQSTVWRKTDFIKLYRMTAANRFGESLDYAKSMNTLNMNGLYHYAGEPKRGGHYDTTVFPYIATAIVKGKWNVSEYPDELKALFREFNIQSLKRGYC